MIRVNAYFMDKPGFPVLIGFPPLRGKEAVTPAMAGHIDNTIRQLPAEQGFIIKIVKVIQGLKMRRGDHDLSLPSKNVSYHIIIVSYHTINVTYHTK
jgi:hypothetical protein